MIYRTSWCIRTLVESAPNPVAVLIPIPQRTPVRIDRSSGRCILTLVTAVRHNVTVAIRRAAIGLHMIYRTSRCIRTLVESAPNPVAVRIRKWIPLLNASVHDAVVVGVGCTPLGPYTG
jgi:hypothetical protein